MPKTIDSRGSDNTKAMLSELSGAQISSYCVQSRRAARRRQQPMHQFQSERDGGSTSETDQLHHQQPVLLLNVLHQLLPSLPRISHRVRWPYIFTTCSGGARTLRQPGHFQVTKVVRQVMRCKRQRSKAARSFRGQKILKPGHRMHFLRENSWQGRSRAADLPARSFDLARPGVAPPLGVG